MKKLDPALSFPNPRLLAAIYFGLLSVVATILINALLTSIGIEELVPVFQSVLLGMIVASATGAVFGERIVHAVSPYKSSTFWTGFVMVIASLPLFVLGLVFLMKQDNSSLFILTKLHHFVYLYFIVLGYSYLLFGFLMAIVAGFAAMYLRGQLVYDILHTHERRRQSPHKKAKRLVKHKVTGAHSKMHASHR